MYIYIYISSGCADSTKFSFSLFLASLSLFSFSLSFSLSIRHTCLLLTLGPVDSFQCPHRAVVCLCCSTSTGMFMCRNIYIYIYIYINFLNRGIIYIINWITMIWKSGKYCMRFMETLDSYFDLIYIYIYIYIYILYVCLIWFLCLMAYQPFVGYLMQKPFS